MFQPKVYVALVAATISASLMLPATGLHAGETDADTGPPFEYMATKIWVHDLEASLAFYETVFGYQQVIRTATSPIGMVQVYTTRGGHDFQDGLTLVYEPDRALPGAGALHTLVFSVRDLADTIKRIEATSQPITRAPREVTNYASAVSSRVIIAFAEDPNGYAIEIVEWRR